MTVRAFLSCLCLAVIGLSGISHDASAAGPVVSENKILVILSSQSHITLKGGKKHPTGFYLNELIVPLKAAMDAGYVPVFASPKGTPAVMDARSDSAENFGGDVAKYKEAKSLLAKLSKGLSAPKPFYEVLGEGMDGFHGLLVPGGHAPMEDLVSEPNLAEILKQFHSRKKPTALICHGPVALLSTLPHAADFWVMMGNKSVAESGHVPKSLIEAWPYAGYKMTVFSEAEEKVAEQKILGGRVLFYPDQALRAAGGEMQEGDAFKPNVVRDRELITGQNPSSDEELGKAFVQALRDSRR